MRKLYTLVCMAMALAFSIRAQAQLTANFSATPTSGCSPIVVQFTDLSTGGPTSWLWDLGNATTSTLQNPSTTYITAGYYTITLTVTNASGTNTKTITNYINVLPTPTVAFMADDSSVSCPPKTVQFTNLSVPNIPGNVSYYWDFGDGSTSTATNPSHTYTLVGTYNVTLVVTNASGCQKSLTKFAYITLVEKPHADFSSPSPSSCLPPGIINFTNASTNATSYQWDFGDGGTSALANPSHTYTAPGTYTVRLIAINAVGCPDTMTRTAYVTITQVHAAFTANPTTVCQGVPVAFTNASTGATSYAWNFGDAGTSAATNPTHPYASSGTFTVRLIAKNGGCADTAYTTITVDPKPTVNFTGTPLTACQPPLDVQFTNTTTGASTYLWSFGDATTGTATNPLHTYTSNGSFTVKLVATGPNGCKDSLTRTAYVVITPAVATITATPTSGCSPLTVNFSASLNTPNVVGSYSWDYGDGSPVNTTNPTPSHTYPAGTYTVTYSFTTTTGCTGTKTQVITVTQKPTADFTASPLTVCPNQTVTYTNNSTNATSYQWFFGDGGTSTATNPTHEYDYPGQYTVTLIAINGACRDTMVRTNYITVQLPGAMFNLEYSCNPRYEITFTNTSIGNNTNSWTYGDATSSTTAAAVHTHTYPGPGTYTVTLTVTNTATGCTDFYQQTVTLYALTPAFTGAPTNICKGATVTFTNTSTGSNSNTWDFGDGGTSTSVSPTHVYTTPGVYTVKLYVMDGRGCKDSLIKPAYITVGGPTAGFTGTPLSGCGPLSVTFTDASTSPITITSRLWRFGDNTTLGGNVTNPTHVYNNSGTYTVTLIVTDANGCKDSLKRTNYISVSRPTAAFTATDTLVCPGQNVHFNNTSTGTATLTYNWAFGDGGTSTATNPDHSYAVSGYYTVRLITKDGNGCPDTLIRTNYIHVYDFDANFTMSDSFATCPPLVDFFTNTTQNGQSYQWTFGNNSSSTLMNPSTIYTYPGVYPVELVVTSITGCKDSITKNVTIDGPTGTLTYPPMSGCAPVTVTLVTHNQHTATTTWDMNNGYTVTNSDTSITYTYTAPGMYVPVIVLSDGGSCNVPIRGTDTIKVDAVYADFDPAPLSLCQTGTVNFTDTTWGSITGVTGITWNFGDNTTGTGHNPSHTYAGPGTYTVTMIATTAMGCKDTMTKTVVVHPNPTVTAGPPASICEGTNTPVILQANGASTYTWTYGPGGTLTCNNCPSPTATTQATTTYTVIGTDGNGCKDTADVTITIKPKPPLDAGPDQNSCVGISVQLQATGAASYLWSPGGTLTCTNCANPVANPAVPTTYTVIGTGANGCKDTQTVNVNMFALPPVNAGTPPHVCKGDTTTLHAFGAASYTWSPAGTLSCTNCADPIANPTITTTYTVIGVDTNGCKDTSYVLLTVDQLPLVNAGPDSSICAGGNIQLLVTGANTYVWATDTSLSCLNCDNPIADPSVLTTYTVTGTDTNGCVNTDQVAITVNPLPTVNVSPVPPICPGESAQLQATGGQTYSWTPGTALSCTNCDNPLASPVDTTTYVVTGMITATGCVDTASVTVYVKPQPVVNAGPDKEICSGSSIGLQVSGAVSYLWIPSSGLTCSTCDTTTASPANTTVYNVVGTGPNGCTDTAQVTVNVRPLPIIDAGGTVGICEGATTQIHATGANTYIWMPATFLSCNTCADPFVTPTGPITYTILGTDIYGCSATGTVNITIIPRNATAVGKGDSICKGASAQLSASGGTSYLWIPATGLNDNEIATPNARPDTTTTYMVIIGQGQCYADTAFATVTVFELPVIDLGPDVHTVSGTAIKLDPHAQNVSIYAWDPATNLSCANCETPVATVSENTTFTLTASTPVGCSVKDDITIFVNCDRSQVFIPNTFTPNNDGTNDRFYPSGKGVSELVQFSVYDRWGELLFERRNIQINDFSNGWDGLFRGKELKPDVYVYIVRAKCATTNEIMEFKGDISLIR